MGAHMTERMLMMLVTSFIALTIIIIVALLFMPSIAEASTLIGVVLGAYVSLLGGTAVGAAVTRSVRKDRDSDS